MYINTQIDLGMYTHSCIVMHTYIQIYTLAHADRPRQVNQLTLIFVQVIPANPVTRIGSCEMRNEKKHDTGVQQWMPLQCSYFVSHAHFYNVIC